MSNRKKRTSHKTKKHLNVLGLLLICFIAGGILIRVSSHTEKCNLRTGRFSACFGESANQELFFQVYENETDKISVEYPKAYVLKEYSRKFSTLVPPNNESIRLEFSVYNYYPESKIPHEFEKVAVAKASGHCDASGGSTLNRWYCDSIPIDKNHFLTDSGLEVMRFYLNLKRVQWLTSDDYKEEILESTIVGPIYAIDISKEGNDEQVLLLASITYGVFYADIEAASPYVSVMEETIDTVQYHNM